MVRTHSQAQTHRLSPGRLAKNVTTTNSTRVCARTLDAVALDGRTHLLGTRRDAARKELSRDVTQGDNAART